MKKGLIFLLAALLLTGCAREMLPEETTAAVTETQISEIQAPETEPAAELHSGLYLPGCETEEMVRYFEEVVLNMEYTDGTGDVTVVQKWLSPIRYGISGSPTEEDLAVLEELFARLNGIPGFPGIFPAENSGQENMSILFLTPDAFRQEFSETVHGEDAFGATQFWYYTETNEIHTARIGYRTDIDQTTRNSVLPEEIVNTLGISDTVLRPDSIVYQYSNDNLCLSDTDLVILKLLYDPAVSCGMDAGSCAAIVRHRYF